MYHFDVMASDSVQENSFKEPFDELSEWSNPFTRSPKGFFFLEKTSCPISNAVDSLGTLNVRGKRTIRIQDTAGGI